MYNPDTDLLFPVRTLPVLRELRGEGWQDLVTDVIAAGPKSIEQMAFTLMMTRMNNCATCNADSYRAMNGCTNCSKQSLKRSRETDLVLVSTYQTARLEVERYLQKRSISYQAGPLDSLQTLKR
jgi:hypothetical protein